MYPSPESAPEELKNLDGPCGPVSVWLVLARHKITVNPLEIISYSRYTNKEGCYAIWLAAALKEFGLSVCFHTDTDPHKNFLEHEAYSKLQICKAIPVTKLIQKVITGSSVIVSYSAFGGEGHFSPLAGAKANKLLLPYSAEGFMLRSVFNKRCRANGIFRQAIVANK